MVWKSAMSLAVIGSLWFGKCVQNNNTTNQLNSQLSNATEGSFQLLRAE